MDRRVGAHEDHTVKLHLVSRLELLVDGHLLVCNKTVENSIISNPRKVTIVLQGNERVSSKRRQSETVVSTSKCLRLERGRISLEQSLDDVDDRRLARTALTIEDKELLDPLRIAFEYRSNSPFDLPEVVLVIQGRDKLVPTVGRTRLQRIWKSLTRVVLATRFVVRKD